VTPQVLVLRGVEALERIADALEKPSDGILRALKAELLARFGPSARLQFSLDSLPDVSGGPMVKLLVRLEEPERR
jgi:hypothetical protein